MARKDTGSLPDLFGVFGRKEPEPAKPRLSEGQDLFDASD
jgi:hypothetical protein